MFFKIVCLYFYFSDWGSSLTGCSDKADIAQEMNETSKEPCNQPGPQWWSFEEQGQLGIDFCSKKQMFFEFDFHTNC